MELYLDSVKFDEIEEANKLGFLTGVTTTPTFMHRDGIKDIDQAIIKLSKMVPILQIEALGDNAEEIVNEAHRLLSLGLDKENTVFKIPISFEGAKACKSLVDEGLKVNLHLVYTLQQAYVGFCAGATYVCPLVGRLQDQGHDALQLIDQSVKVVERYNYKTKIMFSSVRNTEHVRNALNSGVHACTIPWKIFRNLTQNYFTDLGTQQFVEHTRLLTTKARELVRSEHTSLNYHSDILEALIKMTNSKLGAITVLDDEGKIYRIFTDGDLRRLMKDEDKNILHKKFTELEPNTPVMIDAEATLMDVTELVKEKKVDNIIVVENNKHLGIIDIQDIVKWI